MYSWSDVAVRTACVYDAAAASTRDDALLPRMQRCVVSSLAAYVCICVEGGAACTMHAAAYPKGGSFGSPPIHTAPQAVQPIQHPTVPGSPSLLPNRMLPISCPGCAQVCRMRPMGRLRLCRRGSVWSPLLALAGVVGACQQRRDGSGLAPGRHG